MSDKQSKAFPNQRKQPIPVGKNQQNQTGKRGIEPEEQHRQGGTRVSDQGQRKSGGDKR